jgi:hypothetical protein
MKRIKCIFALLHYSMAGYPFNLERFFPIISLLVEGGFCLFTKITSSVPPSHCHLSSFEGSVFSCGVSRGRSRKMAAVASQNEGKARKRLCMADIVL